MNDSMLLIKNMVLEYGVASHATPKHHAPFVTSFVFDGSEEKLVMQLNPVAPNHYLNEMHACWKINASGYTKRVQRTESTNGAWRPFMRLRNCAM